MVARTALRMLPVLAALALAAGCGRSAESPAGKRARVLCTVYPVYILASEIAQGCPGVEVTLLLPAAAGCPHDIALTPDAARRIASCDVLLANGLGLEPFLKESEKAYPKLRVVELAEAALDAADGSPGGKAAEHGHAHGNGTNPHLFASPKRAARYARAIGEAMAAVAPADAAHLRANASALAARLDARAGEFALAARRLPEARRRIVTMHEAFDWLAADAGLVVVGTVLPVEGKAPSAADRIALFKAIREKGAAAVFSEPQYSAAAAAAVAREAGVPVALFDPVASGPADAGPGYYAAAMRKNLETLEAILGERK